MTALPSGYELSDDQARIDAVAAHAYMTRSYWAEGIPLETVERSIAGSFVIGLFHDGQQIGMARLVTDHATMAYLADVYVLEEHRGQGLSKAMLSYIHAHPKLQGLRRWMLFTRDAQELYEQFGWQGLDHPERCMILTADNLYQVPA